MGDKDTIKKKELLQETRENSQQEDSPGISKRSYLRGIAVSILSAIFITLGIQRTVGPVTAARQEDVDKEDVRKTLNKYETALSDFYTVDLLKYSDIDSLLKNSIDMENTFKKVHNADDSDKKKYEVMHVSFSGPEGDFEGRFFMDKYHFGIPEKNSDFDTELYTERLDEEGEGPNSKEEDRPEPLQTECLCEEPEGCCEYGTCRVCPDGSQCNPPPVYCKCECGIVPVTCDGETAYSRYCDVCKNHPTWCANYCPSGTFC